MTRYKEALDDYNAYIISQTNFSWYDLYKRSEKMKQALSSMIEGGWKDISTAPSGEIIIVYGHMGMRFAYKAEHGQWCNMMHRPFIKQPKYWRELPAAPEGESDE